MQKNRRKSIKNYFCSIKVRGKSEISTRLKKGCSLSRNSQNYHFPSFSGAGAGAQNSMECANAQHSPGRR